MADKRHVAVRLDDDSLARLARLQDAMSAKMREMGFTPSMSDALRAIIIAGFPIVEEKWGIGSPDSAPRPISDARKRARGGSPAPARRAR